MDQKIKRGLLVKVSQKQSDGKRERVVSFTGKVIKARGAGSNQMLTVRQNLEGIDVDRIFSPLAPHIVSVEIVPARAGK